MTQFSKPIGVNNVWASGGDVISPGTSKVATGWTTGEIPLRQHFNYLDNKQDQFIAHINQMGIPVWDAVTEYQGNKSYVQGRTNGTIYRAKQTHSNQNPETDVTNTYWIIAFASAGDFYTKTEVDNTFLAKAQNLADLPNAATARTNLGVYGTTQTYTKAEVDSKTTVASTAQAQAGTSNTTLITPLRLTEWSASKVLGIGQTWQDVSGSRVANTTYTNTTGRPIAVQIHPSTGFTDVSLIVDGVTVAASPRSGSNGTRRSMVTAIVPAGSTYLYTSTNAAEFWSELR